MKTRVFRSGNSQAVRIPREFQFDVDEIEIFRRGDEIVLRKPVGSLAEAFEILIPVLPLFPAVADHYGDIRATLERQGIPIGNNDLWIAAHARALGVTLVSNNLREFQRVENLALENWADS